MSSLAHVLWSALAVSQVHFVDLSRTPDSRAVSSLPRTREAIGYLDLRLIHQASLTQTGEFVTTRRNTSQAHVCSIYVVRRVE